MRTLENDPVSLASNLRGACGPPQKTLLGLSETGELFVSKDAGGWAPLAFNSLYEGYYPPCVFTAVAYCSGTYYATGTDPGGGLRLYSSLLCGVWEPVGLVSTPLFGGAREAEGPCVSILCDEASSQLFLVCASGDLVVLPGCPKCVSIRRISDCAVLGAEMRSGEIIIETADGTPRVVPLADVSQIRVSRSHAAELVKAGAMLIDTRDEAEHNARTEYATGGTDHATGSVHGSVCIPLETLADRINTIIAGTVMVFFCEFGSRADQAARFARERGYARVYSMGGLRPYTYVD